MSTEFGMALCALISVVVLSLDLVAVKGRIINLENEIEMLRNYNKVHEKLEANLIKRVDQNSESCSQINDLETEVKVSQKDIERTLDMIEELKAKRSMDILDKLREENKK